MTTRLTFPDQTLNRFSPLENRITQGTKSLHLVSSYFATVRKELDNFRKNLYKSLSPLIQCLQLNPRNDDSLSTAIKQIIKNSEDYHTLFGNLCNAYQTEVIEPFEIFISHYELCNKNVLKDSQRIIENIESHKSKVIKAKEKYVKASKSLNNSSDLSPESSKMRLKNMQESRTEYQSLVNEHNTLVMKKQLEIRSGLEMIEQNEQTRVSLISKNLCKFLGLSEAVAGQFIEINGKATKCLQNVDAIRDLELFVGDLSRTPKGNIFAKMMFEDHGEIYQLIEKINYGEQEEPADLSPIKGESPGIFINPSGKTEFSDLVLPENLEIPRKKSTYNKELIKISCDKLISGKDLTNEEKLQIPDILSHASARKRFAEILSGIIMSKHFIENYTAFETLGQIINTMLTMHSLNKDKDEIILYVALMSGFMIFSSKPQQAGGIKPVNTPLRELISSNSCWRDKEMWIRIIQFKLTRALSFQKLEPVSYEREKATTNPKEIKEILIRRSITFSELCAVGSQMSLLGVERSIGREILIQFATYYGIDNDKLCELLLDFEGAQSLPRDSSPTAKDLQGIYKAKYEQVIKKYENNAKMYGIAKALKYVNDLKSLRNVMLLNKAVNKKLKKRIHKHVLQLSHYLYFNTNPSLLHQIRKDLWKKAILNPSLIPIYSELKSDKLVKYRKSGRPSEETIRLDVMRSFHIHPESDQQSIMNILMCYAIHNPSVDYCQGMNFLAGLFHFIYKDDEATAFAMFASLISAMNIENFYKQDVPLLKMYIYQMNRLIALYFPLLHTHLYEEGINAMYFCSSWLLTSFAYVLQYGKDTKIPNFLLSIYDKYLYVFFTFK